MNELALGNVPTPDKPNIYKGQPAREFLIALGFKPKEPQRDSFELEGASYLYYPFSALVGGDMFVFDSEVNKDTLSISYKNLQFGSSMESYVVKLKGKEGNAGFRSIDRELEEAIKRAGGVLDMENIKSLLRISDDVEIDSIYKLVMKDRPTKSTPSFSGPRRFTEDPPRQRIRL